MYALRELKDRHHTILRLASEGKKNVEIADILGMSPVTVSCVLRSPLARAELSRLRQKLEEALIAKAPTLPIAERLRDELEQGAEEAVRHNLGVLRSPHVDVKVRTRAAMHFMDKVIFKEQETNANEVSYKEILRGVADIERQIRDSTVIPIANTKIIDTKAS